MRIPWALLGLSMVACSSGTPGTASVTGSVAGVSLQAQDAIFGSFVLDDARQDAVLITSYANACDQSRDNVSVSDGTTLTITLSQLDASGAPEPFSPGEFPIGASTGEQRSSGAALQKSNGTCTDTLTAPANRAVSGTVTLSGISADFADGTFDLHFPGGAEVTGNFHAALCAEPTDLPTATCLPG